MPGRILFGSIDVTPEDPLYYENRRQPAGNYEANKPFINDSAQSFTTKLSPAEEEDFNKWVLSNNVPFDPSSTSDYDMRGFYKGLISGDPHATSGINPNDNRLHFTDRWKTPYHESFSSESQYANKLAPSWNDKDQLVTKSGRVLFDERALSKLQE